ncbi:MAG: gluconokinase [Paracoccaceae bacterium]
MLRVVIMGVAGCGKSSVGAGLSSRLAVPYRDGDDLHSAEAVEKMRAGIPLADDDRWPWLDRVADVLHRNAPLLIGCSALKRTYRDRIRARAGGPVTFLHLAGSPALIAARMSGRHGHFMPASLIESQFATLEPPGPDENAVTVSIDRPLDAIVEAAMTALSHPQKGGSA